MHPSFSRAIALTVTVLSGTFAAACSDLPTSPSTPDTPRTFLSLVSSPGDGVGNGFRQYAERADAVFQAGRATSGNRQEILLIITATTGRFWNWTMRFQVPQGDSVRVGVFDNVMRYPGTDGLPGVEISGYQSCAGPTGRFEVKEVAFGAANSITRLRLSFEVTCRGASTPFRGEIGIVPGA